MADEWEWDEMGKMMMKWFVVLCLAGALQIHAEGLSLESTGVRGAFSNPAKHARYYQVEGYLNSNLPWRWDYESGWHIQTRVDLTAGWMNGRGEDAFVGTVGPSFELSWDKIPLTLDVGSSPTILSRDEFGHTDFGTLFQFTTHAGLTWKIGSRASVGCRFQHMSNAGIGSSNPGVNMSSFGLGWRF